MAKKARNDFVDWLQYVALRVVSMILHSFPVEANLQTARFLGTLLYRFDKKHRDRAHANLRRSFPETPQRRRERLARRRQQALVMLGVALASTARLNGLATWHRFA